MQASDFLRMAVFAVLIVLMSGCTQGTELRVPEEALLHVALTGHQADAIAAAVRAGSGGQDIFESLTALDVKPPTVRATEGTLSSSDQAEALCEAI